MPRGITKNQTALLFLEVEQRTVRVEAGLGWDVQNLRRRHDTTRIYQFDGALTLAGSVSWPNGRAGESYKITVYGCQQGTHHLDITLARFASQDEHGNARHRTVRGRSVPDYDPPLGIGVLEKCRGQTYRAGAVWVPDTLLTQMLMLVLDRRPLYMQISELRAERRRWITKLTLRTDRPEWDEWE